jgi:hypothetical protein
MYRRKQKVHLEIQIDGMPEWLYIWAEALECLSIKGVAEEVISQLGCIICVGQIEWQGINNQFQAIF